MRPIFNSPESLFAADIQDAEVGTHQMFEPAIAVVTANNDPLKLGRVKIKVPFLLASDETFWAPIVMIGAGKNRGWFFIPEPDDEVVVLFEHGDINRPVVVGALWNGKDKAADNNPGGNPRRVIKSRAGSKITFDDDQMKLIIEDGGGKGRITFDSNANKLIIEALTGDVCFQAPKGDLQVVAKDVKLTATDVVEIHAGSNVSVGAGGDLTIQAPNVTMSGSMVNINCGKAQMPQAPTASPKDVPDPYSS